MKSHPETITELEESIERDTAIIRHLFIAGGICLVLAFVGIIIFFLLLIK